MTVLITGGAGFIGSRLALALRTRGVAIAVLDNYHDYYDPAVKRANLAALQNDPGAALLEGDVRDSTLLNGIFARYGVRRVVHLASLSGVRYSIERPALYYDVNVLGTLNVLEASRAHQVENVLVASTSNVYGHTAQVPFREDDAADRPLSPYAASKRAAEIIAHSHTHLHGLNVTCLRFFNVYGPHGRPDMMPLRVMRAVCDGAPITLYANGALSRDWTYIDDLIDGVLAALERPLGYQVINLGYGAPLTMTAFVDEVERLAGRPAVRVDTPTPRSEPLITYCDNGRARELLGFAPRVAIREGLARTWEWFVG